MALSFNGRRFTGGRLDERVERVLAHAIGTEFLPPMQPCAKRAHDRALRDLHDAGLPYVSYDAVRRRMGMIQRWFDRHHEMRWTFNRQIPIDLIVVDADGSPVGRPLITLSGFVRVEGDQGWLDAKAEVSFPCAASRTPMDVWRSTEWRGSPPHLKDGVTERRIGDARGGSGRATFRRRARLARVLDDAQSVLGIFHRRGDALSFGFLVSEFGSRCGTEAAVRHLIREGKLWSPEEHEFSDESMIHLASDDAF